MGSIYYSVEKGRVVSCSIRGDERRVNVIFLKWIKGIYSMREWLHRKVPFNPFKT